MAGLQREKLGIIVDRFYEAVAQPGLWRAVLHETGLALGAAGATIVSYTGSHVATLCSEGMDEFADAFVREEWHLRNPRRARVTALTRSRRDVITGLMCFTPEEFDRLPFFAEFASRYGLQWFASTLVGQFGNGTIRLSIDRRKSQEPFSKGEIDAIRAMVPHWQQAGQLALQLGTARSEGTLDAFERLGCAGILLDASGHCVRLNAAAESHLGQALALAHGQIMALHRGANLALQKLIGTVLRAGPAHEGPAGGAVAIPRPNGRPLVVHAAPIVGSAQDVFQRAKAILMLVDPDEHRSVPATTLQGAFGLTPGEVRVALGLLRGQDLHEVAEAHELSVKTLRVYLKAIFAKTGTHRQADLVALLTRMSRGPTSASPWG